MFKFQELISKLITFYCNLQIFLIETEIQKFNLNIYIFINIFCIQSSCKEKLSKISHVHNIIIIIYCKCQVNYLLFDNYFVHFVYHSC